MPSPAMPCPQPRMASPHPGGGCAIPPRTLLLVEDSRLAAEAVRLICRRLGIRLRRAESLSGAALHLRVYRPDIALIDLGLPDGSGLDLIHALARSKARPARLVAISGDSRYEGAALDAGADAFLLKPFTVAQHLLALTGDEGAGDDVILTATLGQLDRTDGADPVALRDDLRRARDLLTGDNSAETRRYAGQFLVSVGRSLYDDHLADTAELASQTGDCRPLVDMVRRRVAATPLI